MTDKARLRAVHRKDEKDAETVAAVFPCPTLQEIVDAVQTDLEVYRMTGWDARPLAKHIRSLMLAYVKGVREWEGW